MEHMNEVHARVEKLLTEWMELCAKESPIVGETSTKLRDSMAYSLLMIPASPLVGAVGDAFGQAGAGLALLGGLVAVSGLVLLGQKKR